MEKEELLTLTKWEKKKIALDAAHSLFNIMLIMDAVLLKRSQLQVESV